MCIQNTVFVCILQLYTCNSNSELLTCMKDVYLAGWVSTVTEKKKYCCIFLGHHRCDKYRILHDGTTHWAAPVHTTLSDFDHMSRSHHGLIWLSCNFVWLLITSTRSWIYHYFWLSCIIIQGKPLTFFLIWFFLIQYKICCLCFNAINSSGPLYLADLLKIYAPFHQLRSSADTCSCTPVSYTHLRAHET